MTEGGHLPKRWAAVACSPSKQSPLVAGMIKPRDLIPLLPSRASEPQKPGPESSLNRQIFSI